MLAMWTVFKIPCFDLHVHPSLSVFEINARQSSRYRTPQDGKIITNNLKKLRMSVDQLEARLREDGIASITDVKTASIEITGQLGDMS